MALSIHTPIQDIGRIDKRIIPALGRLGIKTLEDLLFHFPIQYEDFSDERKISDIAVGSTVTIRGVVESISNTRTFKKRMALTEAKIRDESGTIKAVLFNQPFLTRTISEGASVILSGKVAKGPRGIYLQNPAHERADKKSGANIHTGGLG